jgi:hypothetical protein
MLALEDVDSPISRRPGTVCNLSTEGTKSRAGLAIAELSRLLESVNVGELRPAVIKTDEAVELFNDEYRCTSR